MVNPVKNQTNNHEAKRQKFTQKKQSKTALFSVIGVVAVVVIIGSFFLFGNNTSNPNDSVKAAADIGQTVNYSPNVKLEQTVVESKVENGKEILASLSTIKDKKFVWTEYEANGKRVPLTAFVQPDGKIMVAASLCEPCKGERFHISGNQLICNVCGTIWDLQTLKGISGGCQTYPPEALTYSLNGDNIEVPQSVLDAWTPRV